MTGQGPLLLLVDDDVRMRGLLRSVLRSQGYRCAEAGTLKEARQSLVTSRPDLVLLDMSLPDGEGSELVRWARKSSKVPIIVLSVRDRQHEKVQALDDGADDYVTKPFATGELVARVRAALRRAASEAAPDPSCVVNAGELSVDLVRRTVRMRGLRIHLTPTEFRLLSLLSKNPGIVLTHQRLLRDVWGPQKLDRPHYVRMCVASLRRKLELDPVQPKYVVTEPGVGYRLVAD
jgi:two-component system KDP operon response regulator KdpE